jgi:hypothetical protein
MVDHVASHYSENLKLADAIADKLRSTGKDLSKLTTSDLVAVDEFHIRGRKATLELGAKMNLNAHSHVLDIGSGLGGPGRSLKKSFRASSQSTNSVRQLHMRAAPDAIDALRGRPNAASSRDSSTMP